MSWLPACSLSSLESPHKCSSLQICSNQLTSKTRNNKATKNEMDPKLPKNSTTRVKPGKTSWGSSELLRNKRSSKPLKLTALPTVNSSFEPYCKWNLSAKHHHCLYPLSNIKGTRETNNLWRRGRGTLWKTCMTSGAYKHTWAVGAVSMPILS